MQPAYYGIRRFCPYQGVIQVVDVGAARAYSVDGRHWQVRIQSGSGHSRWAPGRVDEQVAERHAEGADALMQALNQRPGIPFPLADRFELWLLRRDTRLPLAIVKTRLRLEDAGQVTDPAWHPFLMSQSGFRCPALEQGRREARPGASLPRAQDLLERQVNLAARPLPVLQWFERLEDGSGIGHGGLRVDDGLAGRHLPAEAFPELLVDPAWEDPLERTLVEDYHAWNAPLLLAHQNLSAATRERLEIQARRRPEVLLANYPMYPEVLDGPAMQVALVSGKLIQSR